MWSHIRAVHAHAPLTGSWLSGLCAACMSLCGPACFYTLIALRAYACVSTALRAAHCYRYTGTYMMRIHTTAREGTKMHSGTSTYRHCLDNKLVQGVQERVYEPSEWVPVGTAKFLAHGVHITYI